MSPRDPCAGPGGWGSACPGKARPAPAGGVRGQWRRCRRSGRCRSRRDRCCGSQAPATRRSARPVPTGPGCAAGRPAGTGRAPGRPAPWDLPGVEPAEDLAQPEHLVVGERVPGRAQHPDLHAQPAFAVDACLVVRQQVGRVFQVLGGAERPAGPDDGQQLRDVAGQRIPDQMTRAVLLVQPLRGRPHRHHSRIGSEGHPDRSRRPSPQLTPVSRGPDAPRARHPRVSHRVPP